MAETRIQVLSDLHLETPATYDIFTIPPHSPTLALLGDIGYVQDAGFFEFLQQQLSNFRLVLFVLGNHEPYHSNWTDVKTRLGRFSDDMQKWFLEGKIAGEFIVLDQTRYDISPSVTILGCTLFSGITSEQTQSVSYGLNDFYLIEDWSVDLHCRAHYADLSWLNEQVELISRLEPARKIIILTHHSPCTNEETIDPKHKGSSISSGFATDLSREPCWTNQNVTVWAFGHTHFNCDFQDAKTGKRVVSNQRGYYFAQAAGFDSQKVVTV
ncbi:uncharacterized protein Z518_08671 [Rhinocladiella mackenziei CBS 650.93]|uniref:Calcineurin-like phosphoesterase domain-containing protein n=1 Tax=Rhinocladiella mackenziei CBS 650.93 TaxID=1442369 RepID=A0A0D2IA19_9EURO|nr:uncharacterized protein Z518_08671 [Rhinocladiella mackenziei CBS 650.93]KIX02729.1 hypothetical protein Z518_08671 [Rhinocladiella mackenziei CBS 650.93]